jgi:adenylate cyclase
MSRPQRTSAASAVLLAFAGVAIVFSLYWVGVSLLDSTELRSYDLRFQARGPTPPTPEVVLAVVDEQSLDALGRWPWSRARMAALVDALSAAGARVIAFDIGFLEPEGDGPDGALAAAIARSPADVVLGYFFHMEGERQNAGAAPVEDDESLEALADSALTVRYRDADAAAAPFLEANAPETNLASLGAAAEGQGFFTLLPDEDGIVRRTPLVIRSGEEVYPSLALASAWRGLGRPPLVVEVEHGEVAAIRLGERVIPNDAHGRLLLDFRGPAATFPHIPIAEILAGSVDPSRLRDRVVVVGVTATAIFDLRATPFSPVYPGLEVQATALDNLLTGRFVSRPSWVRIADPLAIAGLGLVTALLVAHASAWLGLLAAALLAAGYVAFAGEVFAAAGVWLNVVYPVLAVATSYTAITVRGYLGAQSERRRIESAFGHYVSPVVIEHMLADPSKLELGGEERVLTVLFCDLAGFTSIAERHSPRETIELLSEYFARMTERIYACEGMLKEYVGDELMAIFGAPVEQPDHAARACRAALQLKEARRELAREWSERGRPPLRARTGVNTGNMLVGNVGSQYRFSYGVVGDAVNLGSRLEHLNRFYGTEILIGEQTAQAIGDEFRLRECDLVRAVGKRVPVRMYELIAAAGETLAPEHEKALAHYAAALAAYRERRFDTALAELDRSLALRPADGPSRTLAERCQSFRSTPPAPDWDTVFEPTEK